MTLATYQTHPIIAQDHCIVEHLGDELDRSTRAWLAVDQTAILDAADPHGFAAGVITAAMEYELYHPDTYCN